MGSDQPAHVHCVDPPPCPPVPQSFVIYKIHFTEFERDHIVAGQCMPQLVLVAYHSQQQCHSQVNIPACWN